MKKLLAISLVLMSLSLSGCGYNRMQTGDEEVKAQWSEVVNQYQRRADLVPQLVNVVKGYAAHEKDTLTAVIEARAKATSIQVSPETLKDPKAFQQFQQAQDGLSGALSKLMMVQEKYPDLKANTLFRDLQAQIEGTENRITVARNRYIKSVQGFNSLVRQFPENMTAKMFSIDVKPNFAVENEKAISTAPVVNFGK